MTMPNFYTRREMLRRSGTGLGMLGLAGVLADGGFSAHEAAAAPGGYQNPLAPKQPHFPAKAKHVIHLFMNGGPIARRYVRSQAGARRNTPARRCRRTTCARNARPAPRFASPFKFQKYGESGIEVSEIFHHTAQHIDDIAVIRSMHADVPNHEPSLMLMNCGESRLVRPSMGSWLTYGLGTENQNLPGFIAMCPGGYPIKETQNWQSAFLPGVYQGTYIDTKHTEIDKLIENIKNHQLPRRLAAAAARCARRS